MLNRVHGAQSPRIPQGIQETAEETPSSQTSDWFQASSSRSGTPPPSSPTPGTPKRPGGGNNKSLQERAANLVENPASLVVPGPLGALGLKAVGALAQKQGLHWYVDTEIDAMLPELENYRKSVHRDITLPKPYLKAFHGFPEGANMQYLHALNMEPAIAQFAGISIPEAGGGAAARQAKLKYTAEQIKDYRGAHLAPLQTLLDMGCGTGVTTRAFADHLRAHTSIGLDASDYMLAEAQRLQHLSAPSQGVVWRHALAQQTDLPDDSVDVVTMVFMAHEQPQHIMDAILKEAYRVLKPGGVLAISDYDTQRPLVWVIAHAPGVVADVASALIFEPHLKDYLRADFASKTAAVGFVDYKPAKTCPNVELLLARKPLVLANAGS